MFKVKYDQVKQSNVDEAGASNVKIRWLISEREGAENFAMRLFTLAPGGYTPLHTHPWEHEVFVLKGEGVVVEDGKDVALSAGDVIFVPSEEEHQFRNTSNGELEFICLVPVPKKSFC
jgi:quercetin dioxygenase-like cupin family protein